MSPIRLASLALTLTFLTACAGNQGGGQGPDPEPNPSGAPDAPTRQPVAKDEGPAARPRRAGKQASELEVRIQAPRDGSSFGAAPVEVVVEVTHRGDLRSLTLEGAKAGKAETLAREELDRGKPGGDSGSGGASGGAVEDGDVTFSQTAPGGSDADKTIARAKVAKKVIERILGEWSFSALRGERRREVVTQAIATLRRERFKAYRGKYRYTATVNMPEARNLVLDAFAVERTFGAEPYLLVAEGASWFKGAKLSRDEVAAVRAGLTAASADWLNRWRFKQAGTDKLESGALLQRGPLRESTYQGLGATYGAGLVLVIKGGVAYEPFKGSNHATEAGFQGYLRTKGLICVVYDRTREQIAAQFTVKSSADKRSEDEATTDSAHQPWVAKDASVSEEAERYAQFLGRLVASNVMRRLCADYYANLPPAPTGSLTCPGCGDLCPAGTQRCPACDSPLGPGGGASAPPPATGPSLYRSRYRWLIKDPKVGKNKLRVVAVDSKGRTAADRCTFSFTPPDTEPPLIKIVKPGKGSVHGEKPIEVVIEVSDARGLVSVVANGKTLPGARGKRRFNYRFDYQPSEGGNDLELEARDAAGNVGRAHTSFTYRRPDTTPPVLTLLAPKSGASLTSAPIVIAVSAEDAGGVEWVKINGVKASQDSKGRWRVQIKTPREGQNAIQVEASDAAGNRAKLSGEFVFDSTPPEVEASASLTVKGVMKDLGGTLTINGQKIEFDKETGAYEAKVKPHPDHPHKVIIVATDELGNRSERIEKVR